MLSPVLLLCLPQAIAPVDFGDEVRPILARSCLPCHGFDPSTRQADVRLDTFEGATFVRPYGLGAAVVPGQPEASVLLEMVREPDPDFRMPPEGEPLTADEVALLERWIAEGAEYERHWSLEPPRDVDPPPAADPAWDRDPIDRFVHARLAAVGLEPAPEADRRTLLRRLSFDLIGLPPSPEDVDAFERDDRADAYARQVDRLLASPHFGERWARHWLDLVRYAETYAHEFDYPIPEAWRYRDYVIRALEADVPYDDLVREHLAGDLLDTPRSDPHDGTNASLVGTGWWWLSQGTHAPVDVRADEAERIDNQLDVLSKAFLATTVACARCHDHKFDPILQSEYYALSGFVQSSRRQLGFLDPRGAIERDVAALEASDRVVRDGLARLARERADELAAEVTRGLDAAERALFGGVRSGETPPRPDRPLFGFDGDDWGAFEVEGDAFGDGPTRAGDEPLAGGGSATGEGFANSHVRRPGEGSVEADHHVGLLRSPTFSVDRRYLRLAIGGGHHPGRTGVRVIVDGVAVRDETGNNALILEPRVVDLAEFQGRSARLEIYDDVTGGWGNVRVDAVVLSDDRRTDLRLGRTPAAVAAELGADAVWVERWVEAVLDAPERGPLAAWLGRHRGREPGVEVDLHSFTEPLPTVLPTVPEGYARWTRTGWAFGDAPGAIGEWRAPAVRRELTDRACVDSGLVSDAPLGVLRSPTFTITQPWLHVSARGGGVLRVIVDGYTLDEENALLFESARHVVDADDWTLYSHDLSKYVGHRAHYEIHDDRTADSIRLDWFAWGDGPEPRRAPAFGGRASTAALGRAVARAFAGEGDAVDLRVANWVLAAGLVDLPLDPAGRAAAARCVALAEALPTPPRALAMAPGDGEDERVFHRGDPHDRLEPAPRRFPAALGGGEPLGTDDGRGRLALAEAVLSERNPVAARVPVNRVWHWLFGRGIVPSTDDFGLLGAVPSHPELLDHLALRFCGELDWSLKDLIRTLVLTRTYRTAVAPPSERARAVDPTNALLSYRAPRRLDAEVLRDALLAVSGRLDPTRFGPSVPVHLTDFQQGRGRPGASGPLDGDGRRSIYLEVRRNFPVPFLAVFDCPDPHSTRGRRERSNVPAQALALMNDPFVHAQARLMAERATARAGGARSPVLERIDALWALALQRAPTVDERSAAQALLVDLRSDGGESSALVDLAHVLLQTAEFSFLE